MNIFKFLFLVPLLFFIGCSGWLVNNNEENFFTFYPINDLIINKIKNTTKAIFFTYIAADNNLASFTTTDIEEILNSTKKNLNLFYFIFLDKNLNGDSKLYLAYNGTLYIVKNYGEVDSGNYLTLENIINDIKNFLNTNNISYNDKKFYVIIWDHGDAWTYYLKNRAIALDESSNNIININELVKALKYINENIHKIDLLGFDACLMGNIETLYSIFVNNITNYVVASEFMEPAYGWNYNVFFENVSDPYLVGKNFVDAYAYYYENITFDDYSLALYEKNNTLNYVNYINLTSLNLISQENNSFIVVNSTAAFYKIDVNYPYLVDSYLLLNKSAEKLNFTFNYTNFPVYFKTNLANIKGATISFPANGWISYFSLYYLNSTINPFINTNYGKFIKDYINYTLNP